MNTTPTLPRPGGRNAALKLFGIGVLTLVMIVPLMLIGNLVDERRASAYDAEASIAQGWGGAQALAGPFLVVPFEAPERRDPQGRVVAEAIRGEIVTLPRTLDVQVAAGVEERARGIFTIPVFAADVVMAGAFGLPDPRLAPPGAVFDWSRARIALSISDVRGLSGEPALEWDGARSDTAFAPGTGISGMNEGLLAPVALKGKETPYRLTLRLRGTARFALVPGGESFSATIAAPWAHPSFDGAYLPEDRQIGADGFTASWRVSHLARAMPQAWVNGEYGYPSSSAFGVTFFQPVAFYQLVERSLKYAILFIGLSFLTFFLVETVTGARIHVVQYLLAGAAQVIFYLLLLALAEQTGFGSAYLIAAIACTGLTGLYAGSALGSHKRGLAVAGALTALYALLYTLLNEEDYALLTGAVASFLALALTMFLTRRVDWYEAQTGISGRSAEGASHA
ncbi:MAG: cell envelope integrity protein CreD [Micropepsaceae bacterium]